MSIFGLYSCLLDLCVLKGCWMRGIKRFSVFREKTLKSYSTESRGKVNIEREREMRAIGLNECHQKWKYLHKTSIESERMVHNDRSQFPSSMPKVVNISLDFDNFKCSYQMYTPQLEDTAANTAEWPMRNMHNDYILESQKKIHLHHKTIVSNEHQQNDKTARMNTVDS